MSGAVFHTLNDHNALLCTLVNGLVENRTGYVLMYTSIYVMMMKAMHRQGVDIKSVRSVDTLDHWSRRSPAMSCRTRAVRHCSYASASSG